MKKAAWMAAALVVLAVAAGLYVYLGTGARQGAGAGTAAAGAQAMPAIPVVIAPVEAAPAVDMVQAVGSLLANESVVIRSEIVGRIAVLNFQEGQRVAKGDLLVQLNPDEWAATVRQSRAAVALQEVKMARASELKTRKVVSQQEYDEARAALDEAQAELALAQARLAKSEIRAPFDGILGLRRVSPGDYVEAGQEIVNLEAVDPLKVDFGVPERYAGQIHSGLGMELTVDAYPGERFRGEVYAVDPKIDPASRRVQLRAHVNNSDGRLRPGMFAEVNLVLSRQEDAMWIPEQAIVPAEDSPYVFRIVDGTAARTRVSLGLRRPGQVQVVSGLARTDRVVAEGQMKLHDGMKVTASPLAVPGVPGS